MQNTEHNFEHVRYKIMDLSLTKIRGCFELESANILLMNCRFNMTVIKIDCHICFEIFNKFRFQDVNF